MSFPASALIRAGGRNQILPDEEKTLFVASVARLRLLRSFRTAGGHEDQFALLGGHDSQSRSRDGCRQTLHRRPYGELQPLDHQTTRSSTGSCAPNTVTGWPRSIRGSISAHISSAGNSRSEGSGSPFSETRFCRGFIRNIIRDRSSVPDSASAISSTSAPIGTSNSRPEPAWGVCATMPNCSAIRSRARARIGCAGFRSRPSSAFRSSICSTPRNKRCPA